MKQMLAVTVEPHHVATIEAYAKDMGYPSISATVRRIFDEWINFKSSELNDTLNDWNRCERAQTVARRVWDRCGDPDRPYIKTA